MEVPTHYSGARALGVAALAALALAACGDTPTETSEFDEFDPTAVSAQADAVDGFQVIQTPDAGPIVAGQVIVKFRGGDVPAQAQARFGERLSHLTLGIRLLKVAPGHEMAMVGELRAMPSVEYAEPDYVQTLYAAPNDQYFGYKWGLHNDGTITTSAGDDVANTGAVDADIDWLEAYEHLSGATFQAVKIAILDTGIRQDHEDLAAKVVGQYDFFADDPDATDDNGHGSHTAGIAAAIGNNGVGTTGVAWHDQASLLVAKICGQINPISYGCPSSGTASAITWAADNGARVINLSIGGASGSTAQQDALAYALTQETLAFCSSGNDNGVVSYPAAFPECVAVGATDWSDNRASYSNYGPEVELSAPGGDDEHANGYSYILSAYHESASSYVFMAGTSMAAPMATGLGGLLASLGVSTASEMRSLMASTSDDLGPAGRDNEFGHGRINAYAAVQAVSDGGGDGGSTDPEPEPNQAPNASFTYSCSDLGCSFDGSASNDPDGDALSYSWTFGDGSTGSGATTSHTYASGGTYTVTLTVSDGELSDSQSQSVTVSEPSSGGITLSATGNKVRGQHQIDLTWSGANSNQVDIFEGGSLLTTTANDGAYTHATSNRGSGSYTYQVCEAGTSTCSDQVTVTF